MTTRISRAAVLAACALLVVLTACAPTRATWSGFFFDTYLEVSYHGGDANADIEELARSCEQRFGKNDEGYIGRLNQGQTVTLDGDTLWLLERAMFFAELSGGQFDPTIGAVVDLWDFQAREPSLPDVSALADALATVDYTAVTVNSTMSLPDGVKLDLGGIAKGYAADLLGELMERGGVSSGIINFGGDCLAVGEKPDGSPWRIGIKNPFGGGTVGHVEVRGAAVATSGVYERYFELDGVRYHHLLDTVTGYPRAGDVWSATVVTQHACDADALAGILLLLGSSDGLSLVDTLDGVGCVLVLEDGEILTGGEVEFIVGG